MEPETPPKDTRLIREITLRNILSFGPDTPPFELRPLNVLIGANGSGKSNLIGCIGLMRTIVQSDMEFLLPLASTISDWVWNGAPMSLADIELRMKNGQSSESIIHEIVFNGPYLQEERIIGNSSEFNLSKLLDSMPQRDSEEYEIVKEYITSKSILSQANLLRVGSQITDDIRSVMVKLLTVYENIRIYDEWNFGPRSPLRELLEDSPSKILDNIDEDFSDIGEYLNVQMDKHPNYKEAIVNGLKQLSPSISDFRVRQISNKWKQIIFVEGNNEISGSYASDGTLRYLCLLAILCDPEPPPLICIEEPELGLHMDVLPSLARLLVEASTRTQLIVTTHSDILVDALSDTPESVVVCEKHDGKTEMSRPAEKRDLTEWLKKYSLGHLWLKGEIGGKR